MKFILIKIIPQGIKLVPEEWGVYVLHYNCTDIVKHACANGTVKTAIQAGLHFHGLLGKTVKRSLAGEM